MSRAQQDGHGCPICLRVKKEICAIVRNMIYLADVYEISYVNCEQYVKVLFVLRQGGNQHISHQDRKMKTEKPGALWSNSATERSLFSWVLYWGAHRTVHPSAACLCFPWHSMTLPQLLSSSAGVSCDFVLGHRAYVQTTSATSLQSPWQSLSGSGSPKPPSLLCLCLCSLLM